MARTFATLVLAALASIAGAQNSLGTSKYAVCQAPTLVPTYGCPAGTIFVSNSSSPYANFTSVQAAVMSLPNDTSSQVILIAPGNYTEQVNVSRAGPTYLLGQTTKTALNGGYNSVRILWGSANIGNTLYSDNAITSVLTVASNLNASLTGAGITGFAEPANTPYGSVDFRAYNIDFDNNNPFPYSNGPALAIDIGYSNTSFYRCGFYSYQDTIYVGQKANTYMVESIVAGQTDFFYGFGTMWVEKSQIMLRGCGGGIVAWKGANTTFVNKYGAYMHNSSFAAANSTIAPSIVGQCALGRAWNINDRTIYMNSYLDASIMPAGYVVWASHPTNFTTLTTFGEYNSTGPGFNLTARLAGGLTQELNASQIAPYSSPQQVFLLPDGSASNTAWIDFEFV